MALIEARSKRSRLDAGLELMPVEPINAFGQVELLLLAFDRRLLFFYEFRTCSSRIAGEKVN